MYKLRVAVIGCGRISAVYRQAWNRLADEMQLVLAMDKDQARAQELAEAFPGCNASDKVGEKQFKEILQDVKPDVIHILLPHFLHARYAIWAMDCGINVLTEKPIAITLEDADAMIEARDRNNVGLGVIFQNRLIEGVQYVREKIASGEFGKVQGAFSVLNWHRPPSYYACDWKGKWSTEGGGVVIDQAIHSIDLVRYMTGLDAESVQGHTARRILKNIEVEDEADAAIRLSDGSVYSFFAANYYLANSPIQVEIQCEKANAHLSFDTMTITYEDGTTRVIAPKAEAGQSPEEQHYWGNYHYYQIRNCYEALREHRPMQWTAEDAKKTLAIVQGIYESARVQDEVKL